MQNLWSEAKMEKPSVHKHADRNPAQKRGNEETKHEQQEMIATQGKKEPKITRTEQHPASVGGKLDFV